MGVYLSGNPKSENIPEKLALFIKQELDIKNFIETGTFQGDTSFWASQNFEQVQTIEAYKPMYEQTSCKYKDVKNIKFHLGASENMLSSIAKELSQNSLFFLDAHEFYWQDPEAVKNKNWSDCPLLQELNVIKENCKNIDYAIVVDDIRLIMYFSKNYDKGNGNIYPSIKELINQLDPSLFYFFYHDAFVVVPDKAKYGINEFLRTDLASNYGKQNNKLSIVSKIKNLLGLHKQ